MLLALLIRRSCRREQSVIVVLVKRLAQLDAGDIWGLVEPGVQEDAAVELKEALVTRNGAAPCVD